MSFPLYPSYLKKNVSLALPRPMRALPDQARYFPMPSTGVMAVLTKLQQFAMLERTQ